MKTKLVILTFLLLSLIILSGCNEVESKKVENKTTIDYSSASTTSRVIIVAQRNNTIIDNTFNQTNPTIT